jgi:hypothetical protein
MSRPCFDQDGDKIKLCRTVIEMLTNHTCYISHRMFDKFIVPHAKHELRETTQSFAEKAGLFTSSSVATAATSRGTYKSWPLEDLVNSDFQIVTDVDERKFHVKPKNQNETVKVILYKSYTDWVPYHFTNGNQLAPAIKYLNKCLLENGWDEQTTNRWKHELSCLKSLRDVVVNYKEKVNLKRDHGTALSFCTEDESVAPAAPAAPAAQARGKKSKTPAPAAPAAQARGKKSKTPAPAAQAPLNGKVILVQKTWEDAGKTIVDMMAAVKRIFETLGLKVKIIKDSSFCDVDDPLGIKMSVADDQMIKNIYQMVDNWIIIDP